LRRDFGLNEKGEEVDDVIEVPNFVLDSYSDGEVVEDEVVDVFETGELELYEVEMDNGIVIKATLNHKFMCSDGAFHELGEIIDEDLEMICEDQ
jgi:intein/homing endonuclease